MTQHQDASTNTIRIAVGQLNPTVGDIAGNLARARQAREDAARHGADVVLLTELFIAGYPPEDLVLKPAFLRNCLTAIETLAAETDDGGPAVVIGYPRFEGDKRYNSVAVLDGGKIIASRDKVDLPNYGEFDEKRVFHVGEMPGPVSIRGVRFGIPVCEDIWGDLGVCETLSESGAEILIVPNGSPYYRGKVDIRHQVVLRQVIESGLPMIYANQVGGQDELVFDGASFGMNADKSLAFQMSQFEETVSIVTYKRQDDGTWACANGPMSVIPDREEADYRACMLGLRDYVNKNGFRNVVLGLSGGIDSAICAALAVDALGEERVRTVMLPYRYTSESSFTDAEACARALGCRYDTVAIEEPVQGFLEALGDMFEGTDEGVTEENLQSRARGVILMAISNKFGSMVVTTGNKSEMSVGYATLYGDMNGGFNPIKDLYKMQVYALSRWRNSHVPPGALGPSGEVIPVNIIDKAPSAELRPDQTDQDSLPPYPVLDDILECLVEHEMGVEEIVARGHDVATVHRIEHLLYIAEYKRRQSAPGVKITRKNFGRDRRYPITNRFRDRGMILAFLRDNARWVAGGFLLTFFSSFGQTYFISLSAGDIRAEYGLTHGGFGTLYMLATLASAATLPQIGKIVDRISVASTVLLAAPILAIACLLMAWSRSLLLLVLSVYLLRLFGQGMFTHIAMTAMGRWFAAQRGRAISLTAIGVNFGEALFPISFVGVAALVGWRGSWLVAAAVLLLIALPAIYSLLRQERTPQSSVQDPNRPAARDWTRAEVIRDPLFWAALTGVMAPAFIGTTIFFHQVYLSELRGWPPSVFAASFAIMSSMTILFALVAGQLVDRFTATRLLPVFLVPLSLSCFVLAATEAPWGAYLFMAFMGISYGFSSTLFGALWPELYGSRHLGGIRSLIVAFMVFGTAMGPGVTGALIDAGVPYTGQITAMGLYCVLISLVLIQVSRRALKRQAEAG